jgi:PAS domain S-box-containing protein
MKPSILYLFGALVLTTILGSILTISAMDEEILLLNNDQMNESALIAMAGLTPALSSLLFGILLLLFYLIVIKKEKDNRLTTDHDLDLIRSEEKYRSLIENSHDIIYTINRDGVLTFVSPSWTGILGHPINQVITKPIREFIHPSDLVRFEEYLRRAFETGERQKGVEYRIRHIDGSWRWVSSNGVPLQDGQGTIIGFEGVVNDITERISAKISIRETREQFRQLVEGFPESIIETDIDGVITYVNKHGLEQFVFSTKDLSHGINVFSLISPEDHDHVIRQIQEKVQGVDDDYLEYRALRKDGTLFWAMGLLVPIIKNETTVGLRGFITDISRRKLMEEALRESKERFRTILRSMQFGIVIIDTATHMILEANQKALDMIGVSIDVVSGSVCHSFICPAESGRCPITDLGMNVNSSERILLTISGEKIPVLKTVVKTTLDGKDVLIESFVDITEQKRTEDQIRLINQRLTLAADAAKFGIWDLDLIRNNLEWDDWMLRLYGINREDFGGTSEAWQKRVHPDDQKQVRDEIDLAVQGEKIFDTEFRILRPDGEIRHLKANAVVINDIDNHPVRMTGINYDITDRKQYEWEITQYAEQLGAQNLSLEELSDELTRINQELDEKVKERTEEISRILTIKTDLISQIGHDLKTPLTSLIALLPYIGRRVLDPDLKELFDIVNLDAKRMNQIISSILTLATIDIKTPEELIGKSRVAGIVDRVISAEHLFIDKSNLMVINLISPSFVLRINESHCDLLFSNLISNAVKYSRIDGTITISTEIADDTLCLIVQDDGQGIISEDLPLIFEEFFKVDTSRHDRDSSGLGLALVQRIVQSYGGTITAESEGINMGTTIRVYFPGRILIHS